MLLRNTCGCEWGVVFQQPARVTAQTHTSGSHLQSVDYKLGQVWTMKQGITLTVIAVEDVPKAGMVVHVRVDKIPICGDIHLTSAIEHLAVTQKMMRKSRLVLSNDNIELPESSIEEYRNWEVQKKHFIINVPLQTIFGQGSAQGICNFVPSQA